MNNKFIIIIWIFSFSPTFANTIKTLAEEIKIPIPGQWVMSDSVNDYPFQIINSDQNSELLIFKSIIPEDEIIADKDDLKVSVDGVIDEVILDLPQSKLLTNTGFFDENNAGFILEFTSIDTLNNTPLFHKLKGVIYQHPDGYQILFTLWGKATPAGKDALEGEIQFMLDQFSYIGPSESSIFEQQSNNLTTYGMIIIFILIMVLIFFRKKAKLDIIKYSDNSHFWRCSCGRQNHINQIQCRRCGKEAPTFDK